MGSPRFFEHGIFDCMPGSARSTHHGLDMTDSPPMAYLEVKSRALVGLLVLCEPTFCKKKIATGEDMMRDAVRPGALRQK